MAGSMATLAAIAPSNPRYRWQIPVPSFIHDLEGGASSRHEFFVWSRAEYGSKQR